LLKVTGRRKSTVFLGSLPALLFFIVMACFQAAPLAASDDAPGREMISLKVPLGAERFMDFPIAMIGDDPVTFRDFENNLKASRKEMEDEEGNKIKKEPPTEKEVLERMLTIKLIVKEAREIGLLEVPELKMMFEVNRKAALREQFMQDLEKGYRAGAAEVEKIYKEAVKEYKLKAIHFRKEEDASNMAGELKEGKNFDELVNKYLAEEIGSLKEETIPADQLQPEVAKALTGMNPGEVSSIVKLDSGFVLVKLVEVLYPEIAEAREWASREAARLHQTGSVSDLYSDLVKKYAKFHTKTMNKLDFEAKKPGFNSLLKDKRVLVEIKGEEPITVGDLAYAMKQEHFHGIDLAIERKRLNKSKVELLEQILFKRLMRKEALRRGVDKSEPYMARVRAYEDSILFGAYVEKFVRPEVRLTEEELKAYYEKYADEYPKSARAAIASIPFVNESAANQALEKLGAGTDFIWISEHAEGLVDKNEPDLLIFRGDFFSLQKFPPKLQKVLEGIKPGDYRIYGDDKGRFHVLHVREMVQPEKSSYEELRDKLLKRLYEEKLGDELTRVADKIKENFEVVVYADL